MASRATFTVTDPEAPRKCVAEDVRGQAEHLAADAEARTPRDTGLMAASWRVEAGDDVATCAVVNDAPYAVFVEYGTRYDAPAAPLGQAAAGAREQMRR